MFGGGGVCAHACAYLGAQKGFHINLCAPVSMPQKLSTLVFERQPGLVSILGWLESKPQKTACVGPMHGVLCECWE